MAAGGGEKGREGRDARFDIEAVQLNFKRRGFFFPPTKGFYPLCSEEKDLVAPSLENNYCNIGAGRDAEYWKHAAIGNLKK